MLSTYQPHSLDQKTTDQRAMVPWVPWVPCPWSTFGANLQGLWHWPKCVLMQIAMTNHTNWHHKYSIMCYCIMESWMQKLPKTYQQSPGIHRPEHATHDGEGLPFLPTCSAEAYCQSNLQICSKHVPALQPSYSAWLFSIYNVLQIPDTARF